MTDKQTESSDVGWWSVAQSQASLPRNSTLPTNECHADTTGVDWSRSGATACQRRRLAPSVEGYANTPAACSHPSVEVGGTWGRPASTTAGGTFSASSREPRRIGADSLTVRCVGGQCSRSWLTITKWIVLGASGADRCRRLDHRAVPSTSADNRH